MTATGARPSPAAAGSTLAVGTMQCSAWVDSHCSVAIGAAPEIMRGSSSASERGFWIVRRALGQMALERLGLSP